MDPDIITTAGTKLIEIIANAIRAGKDEKDADLEAAKAVARGDVVSQEMYDRMKAYISSTKAFENNG